MKVRRANSEEGLQLGDEDGEFLHTQVERGDRRSKNTGSKNSLWLSGKPPG